MISIFVYNQKMVLHTSCIKDIINLFGLSKKYEKSGEKFKGLREG